jgi:formate dehydrogenase iron-sulfur subunit
MKAVLTDTTKCIGCRECVFACMKTYGLEPEKPRRWLKEDGLSATHWTSIVERPEGKYVRKQCRHCLQPACVASCPVGALQKTKEGPVIYDSAKCMGCRYCMVACPYGIPRYDWEKPVPYIRKCILCYERVRAGETPACTAACPTQATIFGERDELLAEARRRIQDQPERYLPMIWGEKEIGGTLVLYISDTDLSFLTYGRQLGERPLPTRTAPAMEAVPFAFFGMGATMAGISWIIERRMKRETENHAAPEDSKNE